MTPKVAKAKGFKGWAKRREGDLYRRIHNLPKWLRRHKGGT